MLAGMLSVLLLAALAALAVSVLTPETAAPAATPPVPPAQAAAPDTTPTPPAPVPTLPPATRQSVGAAAAAAGCTLTSPPDEGLEHEEREFTAADYGSNPPTSGTHFPTWYEDGIYAAGTTPELGRLVHALEHGRINLQYAPGTPASTIAQLELLVNELDHGYHLLLFQNETAMPYAVAAAAWGRLLGCREMNDKVFDALRAFRGAYVDKGPETVP
jgi:hypothetical protein